MQAQNHKIVIPPNLKYGAVALDSAPPVLLKVKNALEAIGFQVETHISAKEFLYSPVGLPAIVKGEKRPPDIFIIGSRLSDINGVEFARKIRSIEKTVSIPILMISHETDRKSVMEAFSAGVNDFILKPFNDNDFLVRILGLINPSATVNSELATISHNLYDIVKREVKRAIRGSLSFSIMLVSFSCLHKRSCEHDCVCMKMCTNWIDQAVASIIPALREIDTVIPFGTNLMALALPLTPSSSLTTIEQKINLAAQPVLDKKSNICKKNVSLVIGSASCPEDSEDWEKLLDLARIRLDEAGSKLDQQAETPLEEEEGKAA